MFSKSCKYGIRAVLYLAVHSSLQKRLGVTEIASELEIPKHFLAKILQQLAKENLISSTKGPSGGFFLSKKNRESNFERSCEVLTEAQIFDRIVFWV